MYTDKKVLIGFILGIALGCIFIGIVYDKMHRDNEMLRSDLYEQTQQTHEWMDRYETLSTDTEDYMDACIERNRLSDVIRCHIAEDSCQRCVDLLNDFDIDIDTLGNWSYCY